MRFVILTQYYFPEIGAPQVRLREMVLALKNLGHTTEIVTGFPNYPCGRIFPDYKGKLYLKENIEGISVHRVWLYAATGAGLKRLCNYFSFAISSFLALWRCQRPDFVFIESPPLFLSLPGVVMSLIWKARIILNVADLWPDSVREMGIIQNNWILRLAERLEKWSYNQAFKVTAVTEGIRQKINAKGIAADKIIFLPNGVDIVLFQPNQPDETLARSLGLDGKKMILYAGLLGYAQGLETILATAQLLSQREDVVFVFIGDGPEKAKLQDLTQKYSLKNVLFLDAAPLSFVARLYSFAFAGLAVLRDLPLFQGARPSKIFPIMASGLPVLYSGKGEGAQLIKNAQAGLVARPEDPEDLARAIKQLLDDPDLAKQLGANGRRFAEENLNWLSLVNNWLVQLSRENYFPEQ